MNFEAIKDKTSEILSDIGKGLEIMNRYVLKREVVTRTVISDKKKCVNVVDKESGYSRVYSLLDVIVMSVAVISAIGAVFFAIKKSADRKKIIKSQKQELHRIRKICKAAKVDISPKKD
ncbi:MAG: hypothetical protein IKI97_03845 [Clostridia bacterium]|nr:hypothetical protein [Clostridia bacterium]